MDSQHNTQTEINTDNQEEFKLKLHELAVSLVRLCKLNNTKGYKGFDFALDAKNNGKCYCILLQDLPKVIEYVTQHIKSKTTWYGPFKDIKIDLGLPHNDSDMTHICARW